MTRAARKAPWKVRAWSPRGEKPDSAAETLAREVENDVWGMIPDSVRGEKGFEGMVEELVMRYYLGHQVLETRWKRGEGNRWAPQVSKVVPSRICGYGIDSLASMDVRAGAVSQCDEELLRRSCLTPSRKVSTVN